MTTLAMRPLPTERIGGVEVPVSIAPETRAVLVRGLALVPGERVLVKGVPLRDRDHLRRILARLAEDGVVIRAWMLDESRCAVHLTRRRASRAQASAPPPEPAAAPAPARPAKAPTKNRKPAARPTRARSPVPETRRRPRLHLAPAPADEEPVADPVEVARALSLRVGLIASRAPRPARDGDVWWTVERRSLAGVLPGVGAAAVVTALRAAGAIVRERRAELILSDRALCAVGYA